MTNQYALVPKEIPDARKRGWYKQIIEEFLESDEPSMLVETDKKIPTLLSGLRRAIGDERKVVVVNRGEEVYLLKS